MTPLHLETLVPVVLGCAILFLVSRGLRWIAWLGACAITLLVALSSDLDCDSALNAA